MEKFKFSQLSEDENVQVQVPLLAIIIYINSNIIHKYTIIVLRVLT